MASNAVLRVCTCFQNPPKKCYLISELFPLWTQKSRTYTHHEHIHYTNARWERTPNTLWEPVHWLAAVTGLHHSEGPHRDVSRREIMEGLEAAGLRIVAERTAVLVPAGPEPLVRLGRRIEDWLPDIVLRIIALRRMFLCICDKSPSG